MARNEGNQVTGHMVGTMAPVVGQAMANPLGVISAFVLLGLVCIVIAIVKALTESAGASFDSWGPMALLVAFLAAPYFGHRWFWGPLVSRKAARIVTLVALCVTLVVAEGFLGLVGLAFGRATGFNPRAALMDAGLSTPDAVRAIITNERARVERANGCRNALAGGTMFEGKASSVNWAFNCREIVPIDAQRRACGALADHPANSVNIVNESFCGSLGVRVKERGGAFPG